MKKNIENNDTNAHLNTNIETTNYNKVLFENNDYIGKLISNKQNNNINNGNEKKEKTQRKLYIDMEGGTLVQQPEKYCDNSIRTSQYTLYSFLPLAIINQYKTPFNWFFLIQAIIDCIPSISSVNPVTTIMPVVIVLIISLIREAVEDYRKYSNDKLANETMVSVYKMPSFLKQKCSLIKIGNIIKVRKEEMIPADLLIIKTSLSNGFCYMQTSNLDGETTLKPREAIYMTQKKLNAEKPASFRRLLNPNDDNCYIEVDNPSKDIYQIEGTIFFNGEKTYFNSKNILLRGSRLKNVRYVYGVAIYTGKDTKLMLNINRTTLKISDIDYILGKIVIFLIGMCILVTIIASVIGIIYRKKGLPEYEKDDFNEGYIYYYRRGSSKKNALETMRIIAGHFHMFGVIPISIVIVTAVVKVFQTAFLEFSQEYKQDEGDQIKCYSTTLIEQLGKVKYIFSDKTGTLTKNEMVFKGCSIFTKLYDSSITGKDERTKATGYMPPPSGLRTVLSMSKRSGNKKRSKRGSYAGTVTSAYSAYSEDEIDVKSKISPTFCTDYFIDSLRDKNTPIGINAQEGNPFKTQFEAIDQFLLDIVINHDVLIEKKTEKNDVIYQGVSPDEVTLVSAANEFGYTFISRENNKITVFVYDDEKNEEQIREFDILQKFDFTSERQRSSIIVRDKLNNQIIIYIKGSDKKIFAGKNKFSADNIYEISQKHVDQFARQGLRTLCYSFKYLDENEYNNWIKEYNDLKYKAINDKSLNNKLDLMIEEIEGNSIILGVSALEDKLQDRVKEDIEDFIEAGINFWMITGDKMDTAETIGYSCGIISEDSEVYKIRDNKDVNEIVKELESIKEKISKTDKELAQITEQHQQKLERIRSLRKMNSGEIDYNINNNILNSINRDNNNNNINISNNINNNPNIIKTKNPVNQATNNINQTNVNNINNNTNNINQGNFIFNYKINIPNINTNNSLKNSINTNNLKNSVNTNNLKNSVNTNNNLDEKTICSLTGSEKTANQNEIFDFVKTKLANTGDNKYDEISFIQENARKMQTEIMLDDNKNITEGSSYQMNLEEKKELSMMRKNTRQLLSEKNNFNKAYDYFQDKLYEY